ncbi:MAG: hypothetical protein IPL61_24580 [Myxococcales bacterium]|nr:hypothetical protein [Myxococcales bacterium]
MHHLTKWKPILTSAFAVALGGVTGLGCNPVDCGDGTIEKDGTCVPADDQVGQAQCGEGTVLGADGKCEPEMVVVCDPDNTTAETDPVTGVVTCHGTGTQTGCAPELPCPTPSGSNTSICGRIHDTQTGAVVAAVGATGTVCNPNAPTADGPCSLKLTFYDALDFATSSNPTPLVPGLLTVDDCGRYAAINVPPSNLGFTGIGIDDANGVADTHVLTGVALPDGEAVPARGFEAFITRKATDTAWSAGLAGESFATRGVIAMIFRHGAMPVAGVRVRRNSNPIPADDYYFTDAGPERNSVDIAGTQSVTGANGSALVINAPSPTAHDGVGAEPAGCTWPNSLAASIRGVVFVQVKEARNGQVICP